MGFRFGYSHRVQPIIPEYVIPEYQHEWVVRYLEMYSWMLEQPPVFLPTRRSEDEIYFYWREEWSNMTDHLDEIEHLLGPLPLSIRLWYQEIGGVNFYGYYAPWAKLYQNAGLDLPEIAPWRLMSGCDPLMIYPLDSAHLATIQRKYRSGSRLVFEFAPNRNFKDFTEDEETPYQFSLPDRNMDVKLAIAHNEFPALPSGTTFVQYLRISILKWAGFPGMAEWPNPPVEDLALLTRDLIPF